MYVVVSRTISTGFGYKSSSEDPRCGINCKFSSSCMQQDRRVPRFPSYPPTLALVVDFPSIVEKKKQEEKKRALAREPRAANTFSSSKRNVWDTRTGLVLGERPDDLCVRLEAPTGTGLQNSIP